jgi:hypothetical protein
MCSRHRLLTRRGLQIEGTRRGFGQVNSYSERSRWGRRFLWGEGRGSFRRDFSDNVLGNKFNSPMLIKILKYFLK